MKFSYPNMHMQNTWRAVVVVTLVCYLISISCCNLGATVVRRKIRNHRCIMRPRLPRGATGSLWMVERQVRLPVHVVRDRSRLPLVFTGRTTMDDRAVPRQFHARAKRIYNFFRILHAEIDKWNWISELGGGGGGG